MKSGMTKNVRQRKDYPLCEILPKNNRDGLSRFSGQVMAIEKQL